MASADNPEAAGRALALREDREDPLCSLREQFQLPRDDRGKEAVYLCGNSLGCLPKAARKDVGEILEQWGGLAVGGHHRAPVPWISFHEPLAAPLAALAGALPGEVVAMNSLTVNLHLMLTSFYRPTTERFKVVMEAQAFPSDRYAVVSQMGLHGLDPSQSLVEVTPRTGESFIREDDLEETLRRHGPQVALVLLGGVHYLTGQLFDMGRVAAVGREVGAVVGFDLAHAMGNVPLSLHDWEVDFAVWCSYKYLNGGPGAPGGAFVHARHGRNESLPRLTGWWGTDPGERFKMSPLFHPQAGAPGWQISNPPILSMAALAASLRLFSSIGMEALRERSVRLTGYLERLLLQEKNLPVRIMTPKNQEARGCQISLAVPAGARDLALALGRRGVVCDTREPDILRAAPVPLYNRFEDVWVVVQTLKEVAAKGVGRA
ncbi:MAG: kynureninase [Acidobacteriota bacterium]